MFQCKMFWMGHVPLQNASTYDNNELLQKCGCHLYQTHDGEDITELNVSIDD